MTDAGLFERVATAVLRESNSQYRLLAHPGVNVDGKTTRAPVDGVMFVTGAKPPHMIAVHHTTSKRKDLEKKWLHDPATVNVRKEGTEPTAPAGDLVKTIEIFAQQKQKTPDLRATLILTTNEEPPESLVRDVNAIAEGAGLEVEIWSRSALAHFLDFDPKGQWIRKEFLQIEQERLSSELLQELSRRSLEYNTPPDGKEFWVDRGLDHELAQLGGSDIVFVVAESGLGKSVACYRRLAAHVEAGGYGLVLPHDVIAETMSLDQAIDATLRRLHPLLAIGSGSEARSLASEHSPLLLIVEDVNKSGQPAVLLEKLASWRVSGKDGSQSSACRILCPVWPRILTSLGDEARKRIDKLVLTATAFSPKEGAAAVQRRREEAGLSATQLEADAVSAALGHDPLLIALHDPAEEPKPDTVIERFIGSSLGRLAQQRGEFTAAEYRQAIRHLAAAVLERRRLDLTMVKAAGWFAAAPDTAKMLRHIAAFGEILHTAGPASDERLSDDWITHEVLMRLPAQKAEELLLKHWDHLRFSPYFVQAALYVATPVLIKAAAKAVAECPNPKELFAHVTSHFGYKMMGHPGITRRAQIESLIPYLDHLSDLDIQHLWDACNDHGWFDLRRRHIDHRLKLDPRSTMYTDDALAIAELDTMLAKGRSSWADHWIDEFLKTGVSVDHVMELVRTWLTRQKNLAALELAAEIVIHAGTRSHLAVLGAHSIGPVSQAASVIANASFAVQRRSLI